MFMAFHSSPARKAVLLAAAMSLIVLGIGTALSFG